MYLSFRHQIQILNYHILAPDDLFLLEISLGTLACHGPQVCRVYLKDTSPHHSPSSFLSVLEMVERCPWEWSQESMQDILSCSNNNKLA